MDFTQMKKINKLLLCLATVAILGGCSNSSVVDEAKKAVADLSLDKVTYTSGHAVVTLAKFSSNGQYSNMYAQLMELSDEGRATFGLFNPIEAGSAYEIGITKEGMSSYFIDASSFDSLKESGATFTVNGTAVSYTYTINKTERMEPVDVNETFLYVNEYNEEGLATKQSVSGSYAFDGNSDKFEYEITTVITWSK